MAEVREIEVGDAARAATRRALASAEELPDAQGEKMVLNMGPSHPSTHGVLRIVLELDGETITRAMPEIAFSKTAPLEGGPFVTQPGARDAASREPRVRRPEH